MSRRLRRAGNRVDAGIAQADTIAQFTFETSVPTTAGPYAPEVGSGAISGFHAGATTYSNPVGNGSAESFSSNGWAPGDYYLTQVDLTGYENAVVSWDQASSNTGPLDFDLQYSTNGTTFTSVLSYDVFANASPNPFWDGTTHQALYFNSYDFSAITAIDNLSTVYFRMINTSTISANGGTVAGGGTNRIDNVTVTASAAVPEPSSIALAGMGLAGFALSLYRRRKTQA